MEMIKNFMQEEDGVTAIEYGLIAGLIAVVIIVAVTDAGAALNRIFEVVKDKLEGAADLAEGGGTGA